MLSLVNDIATRKGFGNLLAEGTNRAAEQIGHHSSDYALHVKGVEMVSFDPRSQTN